MFFKTPTRFFFNLCDLIIFLFLRKKVQTHRKEIARDPESAIRLYQGNIHDLIEESSGSGSGVPRIVQQTICKQIGKSNVEFVTPSVKFMY